MSDAFPGIPKPRTKKKSKFEVSEIVRLRNSLMLEIRHGFELQENITQLHQLIEAKDKFIIELLNKICPEADFK